MERLYATYPKIGAVCGKTARTDLFGAMGNQHPYRDRRLTTHRPFSRFVWQKSHSALDDIGGRNGFRSD